MRKDGLVVRSLNTCSQVEGSSYGPDLLQKVRGEYLQLSLIPGKKESQSVVTSRGRTQSRTA